MRYEMLTNTSLRTKFVDVSNCVPLARVDPVYSLSSGLTALLGLITLALLLIL
jgi:hypothetical protein